MKNKVWILMSVDNDYYQPEKLWWQMSVNNDYNQPKKVFEKAWWHRPTYEELRPFGFDEEDANNLSKPKRCGEAEYWVEVFTEN